MVQMFRLCSVGASGRVLDSSSGSAAAGAQRLYSQTHYELQSDPGFRVVIRGVSVCHFDNPRPGDSCFAQAETSWDDKYRVHRPWTTREEELRMATMPIQWVWWGYEQHALASAKISFAPVQD